MAPRDPIALETEDDSAQRQPDAQEARPSRASAIPPLSVREPFWWAVASTVMMVVAVAFLLLIAGG